MTISIADVPAVSPGGLSLTPSERWTLSADGVLTVAERDGGTLVLWLDGAARLYEQYYPAAKAAALDCWREEYPQAARGYAKGNEPDLDDGLTP